MEAITKGKSRKKLIIVIIIIAAVVAAGLFGYNRLTNMTAQNMTAIPSTVVLEKTNLESKVTGSGNFASAEPVTVGSNVQYGEVKTVYAEAGDIVYEGDVLAVLETSDIERNISDTQEAITEAAKNDAKNLAQAQRSFNDTNTDYYKHIERNEQAVHDAEDAHEKARANEETAKKTYETAKANAANDPNPTDPESALQKNLMEAKAAYDAAKDAHSKADAAVTQAKQALEDQTQNDNSAWYNAQDQLSSAQGQDSAKKDRSTLESLNEDLSNASIVSPISGVVTKVNTEDGKAASGDMFTVEDTGSLQVSTSVAEYDVIKIEAGMKAYITSNATDEQEYEGVVDYVASVAADTGGNFEVIVNVTSEIGQLRPGMTATVEIVTASKSDIFAVPIDAVVTRADGQKVVYVYESEDGTTPFAGGAQMDGAEGGLPSFAGGSGDSAAASGTPPAGMDGGSFVMSGGPMSGTGGGIDMSGWSQREIEVETGMETDYYIEISSDELSEGMMIVADPEGRNVQTNSGMEQFMMGGGMGGAAGGAERPRGSDDGGTVVVSGAPQ